MVGTALDVLGGDLKRARYESGKKDSPKNMTVNMNKIYSENKDSGSPDEKDLRDDKL